MASVGVSLIVKDEVERVKSIITSLRPYVDAFYITVSDQAAYEQIEGLAERGDIIRHRKWNNNFADARNANLRLVKTDYWVWLDADDVIEGAQNLRDIAKSMEQTGTDVVYFPYHYKRDHNGDTVNYQWRERLISSSLTGKWLGALHETFVSDTKDYKYERIDGVQYYHNKTQDEHDGSQVRNHKILEKLYKKEPRDPRDVYYYAISCFNRKEWDLAIKLFIEHINTSGWDEERYFSWCYIAESHIHQKSYDKAISACFGALEILPHYPDAHFVLQQIYYEMEMYEKSLEWYRVGTSKAQPDTNRVTDPTVYTYRAKFSAAMSLLFIGEPIKSFQLIQQVMKVQPNDPEIRKLYPEFERAYLEAQAVDKAKWLASYSEDHGGVGASILEGLPGELKFDVRLRDVRQEVIRPVTWPEKSIVFYCGPAFEPWGPDTLDKGMGGSEEAVVYLSRELAKLGWKVTIYNDRISDYNEFFYSTKVTYKPWTSFNPSDTFDVMVAWRNPTLFERLGIKARLRVVDLHDMPHSELDPDLADKFFFKSNFHKSQSDVGDKAVVISNGIDRSQFNA